MIQINSKYDAIFDARNIDLDCDKIANLMSIESDLIKEALDAGLYKQGITMYPQLLKSMCEHFIKDEHWCYFDDMYSPEYVMQRLFEEIEKSNLNAEEKALLDAGHDEIMLTECYEDFPTPHI